METSDLPSASARYGMMMSAICRSRKQPVPRFSTSLSAASLPTLSAGTAHETYQSAAFRVMSSSQKFQVSTITEPLKNRELDQGQVVHWRTPLYIRPTCDLQFYPPGRKCHYWHQGLEN